MNGSTAILYNTIYYAIEHNAMTSSWTFAGMNSCRYTSLWDPTLVGNTTRHASESPLLDWRSPHLLFRAVDPATRHIMIATPYAFRAPAPAAEYLVGEWRPLRDDSTAAVVQREEQPAHLRKAAVFREVPVAAHGVELGDEPHGANTA